MKAFIAGLPKAELHIHIEGSLEPEMMWRLAERNQVTLPYKSVAEIRAAYDFTNLQSFLDLYYAGAAVLVKEEDFYEMTKAYLQRAINDNVVHAEIMFDPQTHTARGVAIDTVFAGIVRALDEAAEQHDFSSSLIMSFLRHLSEEDAQSTLDAALPLYEKYKHRWTSIGLDSGEVGNPPSKFARVFAKCKALGFRLVAHAGEEGPPSYVTEALDLLQVERIDHGVRSEEDAALMARLAAAKVPLTVCPLSNLKLCVVKAMGAHNLRRLLAQGLCVTINSDDPSYFGGYINDNYLAVQSALNMTKGELVQCAKNSFTAAFLPDDAKARFVAAVDAYAA